MQKVRPGKTEFAFWNEAHVQASEAAHRLPRDYGEYMKKLLSIGDHIVLVTIYVFLYISFTFSALYSLMNW
jgi:hypothetical protein